MTSAIIVAAGQGKRMGADKLFMEALGAPIVAHSWAAFEYSGCVDEVVLVVREERNEEFHGVATRFNFKKPYRLVNGGAERQDSVWNGLHALAPSTEIVLIHDAARPCVTDEIISACVSAARQFGAAVAAEKMVDTVKSSLDGLHISQHLDRSRLWSVQTPQTFRKEVIIKALAEVKSQGLQITDDTAACELIGQPVRLVESATRNPKLTAPGDLELIELLLQKTSSLAGRNNLQRERKGTTFCP